MHCLGVEDTVEKSTDMELPSWKVVKTERKWLEHSDQIVHGVISQVKGL